MKRDLELLMAYQRGLLEGLRNIRALGNIGGNDGAKAVLLRMATATRAQIREREAGMARLIFDDYDKVADAVSQADRFRLSTFTEETPEGDWLVWFRNEANCALVVSEMRLEMERRDALAADDDKDAETDEDETDEGNQTAECYPV